MKKKIIFDFDGTICYLFSDYSLDETKNKMKKSLEKYAIDLTLMEDAFDVFDDINKQLSKDDEKYIKAMMCANEILTEAECDAVPTSKCLENVIAVLLKMLKNGYEIGFATNNSDKCVKKFLELYHLPSDITVVGRQVLQINKLKPDPYSIMEVIRLMNVSKDEIVFVGDTWRDLKASQTLGVEFVAMLGNERKKSRIKPYLTNEKTVSNYDDLYVYLETKKQ